MKESTDFGDSLANARKGKKVSNLSFDMSQNDQELIVQIMRRGVEMASIYGVEFDYQLAAMDISAVHCNSCPLNLFAFLTCSNDDFAHDFTGIGRFIDRTTGALRGGFTPRNAKAKQ